MLDVVTTALEVAATVLLVVAAGWAVLLLVGVPYGWPAGLAASGLTAGAASLGWQWVAARAGRDTP